MKTCIMCNADKAITEFYPADKKCKVCRRSLIRAAMSRKAEYYKEYDRKRYHENDARKAYQQAQAKQWRLDNPQRYAEVRRGWIANHPQKRAAQNILNNAVKAGVVVKQPCVLCGKENADGHHDDYDKPLEVVWLCRKHHADRHRELREAARADNLSRPVKESA